MSHKDSIQIHKLLDELTKGKEDQRTIDIFDDHLMLEKKFRAPLTRHYIDKLERHFDQIERKKKLQYDIIPNFDFYLRFYFPRSKIIKRFDNEAQDDLHLIIMFNGLDESLPRNFKLYNRLGASFAHYGIASVLFPTPFHLNRASEEIKKRQDDKQMVRIPSKSLLENPWYLPNNFAQTILEFNYFLRLIKCEFKDINTGSDFKNVGIKALTQDDINFYNMFFGDKKLDVSLLGYSLGGLKALSCFKKDPEKLKTCILLNSGGTLRNLKLGPPIMKNDIWQKEVVEHLIKRDTVKDKHKREFEAFNNSKYEQIISSIIFDEENVFNENKFDKHVCKIIIVAGGKDRLVQPESIKRLETKAHGLNILQISDLGHFIDDDPQFNRWYSRIINLLINFFEDIEGESISRNANLVLFSMFNFCCDNKLIDAFKNSKKIDQLENIVIDQISEKCTTEFRLLMKSLFAYHKSIKEFIDKLEKHKKKNELFFGQLAEQFAKSEHEKLEEIILSGDATLRSGEKLAKADEFPEHQIVKILIEQVEKYIKLIGDDTIGEHWRQILNPFLEKKKKDLQIKSNASTSKTSN